MGADRWAEGGPRGTGLEDPKDAEEDSRPLNAICKRFSEDGTSRKVGPSQPAASHMRVQHIHTHMCIHVH